MLLTLVLVFCTASSGECIEHRPMADDIDSPTACLLEGQQFAHEWLEDHPGWTLTRLRCEPPRSHDDDPPRNDPSH